MRKRIIGLVLVALCIAVTAEDAPTPKVKFVASKKREPFHLPDCEWAKKISNENLESFATRDEAIKAGHRPCKVCNP